MSSAPLRLAAVALTATASVVSTSVPAQAADSSFNRSSGVVATTSWVQVLDLGQFGNVHVGQLYAFETTAGQADVFSFIEDYQCPAGVLPPAGGHFEEPAPNPCEAVGSRVLEGQGVAFTFSLSRRSSGATLNGRLTAATAGDPHTGEGGTALGTVPVAATWTGSGELVRGTSTYRDRQGDRYESFTTRSTRQEATMTGRLGPMLFEEAASATGTLETYRSMSRSRS